MAYASINIFNVVNEKITHSDYGSIKFTSCVKIMDVILEAQIIKK